MKKEFIGHFKRPANETSNIWKTANFVFDANVLLNLYRYSSDTRDDFLNLFDRVKEQIWLPEQVGYEFLKNRPNVISEQSKAYASAIKSVEELSKSFSEERAHPFISHNVKIAYDKAAEAIKGEMSKNQTAQEKLLTDDTIRDKIADLFEGKVGTAYSAEDMSAAFAQGAIRFAQNTPPGYMDEKKFKDPKTDVETRSNFGDWILWRQLMDFAKVNEKPVILVTNDTKEDWWLEQSGKTLGPRPELIAEFFAETKQHILIYKPERFLDLGKQNLHAKIDDKSIAEVSSERETRELSREKHMFLLEQSSQRADRRLNWVPSKKGKLNEIPRHPISEKERDWRLESLGQQLHKIETDLEHAEHRVTRFQYLFSEAIDAGDHNIASEMDGHVHEAMLERENLSELRTALRNAYVREERS